MFIGISGVMGAGKSTLMQQLVDFLGKDGAPWRACHEPVDDNPYLTDFYADMSRWTFNMQLFLLAKRFALHQEVIWDPRHQQGGGVVQDRTIYEDTIFATMHRDDGIMPERDFDTYSSHFNIMRRYLVYPDVILHLRVRPEVAQSRIGLRDRQAEREIPFAYLQRLHRGYEEFASEMERYTAVVSLDWNEFQPIETVVEGLDNAVRSNGKFLRSLRRI